MPNLNFTIPAATQVGDYLEAYVMSVAGDSTLSPPPTGWQFIRTISVNSNVTADVYGKIAAVGDAGARVTWNVTTSAAGLMFDIIGATGEDDYKAFALSGYPVAATPGTLGSTPLNATGAGQLAIIMMLVNGSAALIPPSGGWTTIREFQGGNLSVLAANMTTTQAGEVPGFTIDFGGNKFDSFCAAMSYLGTSSLRTFSVA